MGEGRGNEGEKQEGGEAGVKRGKRNNRGDKKMTERKKERKHLFFLFCFYIIMDCAGIGVTQVAWRACMFNDTVCQGARALCVPANVSTAPKYSCAHLKKKKGRGGERTHKNLLTVTFLVLWMDLLCSGHPHFFKIACLCQHPAVCQTFIKLCCLHLNECPLSLRLECI